MPVSTRALSAAAGGLVLGSLFAAPAAFADVIFSDSFENPVNDWNWQVYPATFGDWSSNSGSGIEIQTSGVVVTAYDGNQYVELDSDTGRGGDGSAGGTNSSMTRLVELSAGSYELSWYYQPRTSTDEDNLIQVYVDGRSDPLFTTLIGSEDGTRSAGTDWMLVSYSFTVDGSDNDYGISFLAGGKENTLGGFIDMVTLTRVPEPGALALLGLALAGVGGLRRRQRR